MTIFGAPLSLRKRKPPHRTRKATTGTKIETRTWPTPVARIWPTPAEGGRPDPCHGCRPGPGLDLRTGRRLHRPVGGLPLPQGQRRAKDRHRPRRDRLGDRRRRPALRGGELADREAAATVAAPDPAVRLRGARDRHPDLLPPDSRGPDPVAEPSRRPRGQVRRPRQL